MAMRRNGYCISRLFNAADKKSYLPQMNANNTIIDPSHFNRKITVKQTVASVDEAGGVGNSSFQTLYGNIWASVESMNTGRKVFYGFDTFDSVYEIRMRYEGRSITTAMLVDYEDSTLSITSVQLIRQSFKQFLIIIAKEVNPIGQS